MMAAGGDPAMMAAGGDPAAGGAPPSIEEILAEIEAALQSGAITPEQAEEIIQILSTEMGGGGAPQPDPAAGAAPVM
jgi:mono/diheme cytochrome c family protein